jgi:hypothetical protein
MAAPSYSFVTFELSEKLMTPMTSNGICACQKVQALLKSDLFKSGLIWQKMHRAARPGFGFEGTLTA